MAGGMVKKLEAIIMSGAHGLLFRGRSPWGMEERIRTIVSTYSKPQPNEKLIIFHSWFLGATSKGRA